MKKQEWLREYGYQCVVTVDEFKGLSSGSVDVTPGTDLITIQASSLSTIISLCGLQARARAPTHGEFVRFTIGGILLIDNKAFGLTVRHVLEAHNTPQYGAIDDDASDSPGADGHHTPPESPESFHDESDHDAQSDSEDPYDSEDESDSSPFITSEKEPSIQRQNISSSEEHASALVLLEVSDHFELHLEDNSDSNHASGLNLRNFGHFITSTSLSTARQKQLDWSLIKLTPELEDLHQPLTNTYETPSDNRVSINKFLQRSTRTSGEVWINCGTTGIVKGWLMALPVLLHQGGKTLQALQVMPDETLGTWNS